MDKILGRWSIPLFKTHSHVPGSVRAGVKWNLSTVCPRFCSKFSCLLMAWSCKRLPAFTEEISSALVALPGSLLPLPQHPICQKKESPKPTQVRFGFWVAPFFEGKATRKPPNDLCIPLFCLQHTHVVFPVCTSARQRQPQQGLSLAKKPPTRTGSYSGETPRENSTFRAQNVRGCVLSTPLALPGPTFFLHCS